MQPLRLLLLILLIFVGTGCGARRSDLLLFTVAGLRSDAIAPEPGGRAGRYATVSPLTVESAAALLSGQIPSAVGFEDETVGRFSPGAKLIAEQLRTEGFQTAAFVGDGELSRIRGFARGFDSWEGADGALVQAVVPQERQRLSPRDGGWIPCAVLADRVATWLKARHDNAPLFLWVHCSDPRLSASGGGDATEQYRAAVAQIQQSEETLRTALQSYRSGTELTEWRIGLHGMALGDGGELGSGLLVQDSTVVTSWEVRPASRVPTSTAEPVADFRWLHDALAAGGTAAAPPTPADRYLTSSRAAARDYGWPTQAVAWVGGKHCEEAVSPECSVAAPLLKSAQAAKPSAAQLAILPAVARAVDALRSGKSDAARQIWLEIWERSPSGLLAPAQVAALSAPSNSSSQADRGSGEPVEPRLLATLDGCPGSSLYRIECARVLLQLGAREAATMVLDEIDRSSAIGSGERLLLAELWGDLGKNDRAEQQLAKLLESEPIAPELEEWRGDLLSRSGNFYRARLAYESAISVPRGRGANTVAKLGDALHSLGENDAALQRYAEALQIDPTYLYPHSRAGVILLAKGETAAATQALVSSIGKSGSATQDALWSSELLEAHGLLPAAAAQLQGALESDPGSVPLTLGICRIGRKLDQQERARPLLEAALKLHPEQPSLLLELARFELLAKRPAEARAALTRALPRAGVEIVQQLREEPLFRAEQAGAEIAALIAGARVVEKRAR